MMRALIASIVRDAAAWDDWLRAHPPTITFDGFQSSGSLVSRNDPSVRTLARAHQSVRGVPMEMIVATSINDMRYFNFIGIPAGCYGATDGNGHAADEWLDSRSLVAAAKVIGGFLLDRCGVAT